MNRKAPSLPITLCLIAFGLLQVAFEARADISSHVIDVEESDQFSVVFAFEFATGGVMEAQMTLQDDDTSTGNNTLQLLWVDDAMVDTLKDITFGQACNSFPDRMFHYLPPLWQTNLQMEGNTQDSFNYTVPSEGWYRLLQLNCAQTRFSFVFAHTAVNPGGEYLSLSQVPFKTLSEAGSIVWGVLAAVWVLNWYLYRFFNIRLQQTLTAVPLALMIQNVCSLYRWRFYSRYGFESNDLFWSTFFLTGLARGVLFAALMFIAKGCFITRAKLERNEWTSMGLMTSGLVGLYLIYSKWAGFMLFPLLFMYLVILRYIFVAIAENGLALHAQVQLVREMRINPQTTPVWEKLLMFRRLQTAIVVYICADVVMHLWAGIFLIKFPWAGDAAETGLSALLCMFVGYTFRLRPFNPYYHLVASASRQERSRRAAADVDESHNQYNSMVDNDPESNAGNGHDGSVEVASEDRTAPLIHAYGDDQPQQQPPPSRFRSAVAYVRGVVSRIRVPHPSEGPQNWDDADSAVWRPGMPLPHVPVDFAPWLDQNAPGPIVIVENPPRLDSDGQLVNDVVMARPVYTSISSLQAQGGGARSGYVAPAGGGDIPLVSLSRRVHSVSHVQSAADTDHEAQENELVDLRNTNTSTSTLDRDQTADGGSQSQSQSPTVTATATAVRESGHVAAAPAPNGSGYSALGTEDDVDTS